MNRIDERRTVFEIAFSFSFNNDKSIEEIVEIYKENNDIEELSDYVISTLCGIHNNLTAIDEKIDSTIKSRKFNRLDNICLTALRYGAYEILYSDDIPDGVAINEAIELTKKYDDSLCAFVNGNLALIAKEKNV